MPEICPKIAQDISKICLRYAQALPKVWGFILRKWDKMSPGRVHQLGQYVSGEVHNAVGQFVLGTKCLLTIYGRPLRGGNMVEALDQSQISSEFGEKHPGQVDILWLDVDLEQSALLQG